MRDENRSSGHKKAGGLNQAGKKKEEGEEMNTETMALIFMALWVVSEALSYIPAIKANGVFQLIHGIINTLTGRKEVV